MLTDPTRRALVLLTNVSEAGATPAELGDGMAWQLKRDDFARTTLCGERLEITRAGRNALAAHERTAANVTR